VVSRVCGWAHTRQLTAVFVRQCRASRQEGIVGAAGEGRLMLAMLKCPEVNWLFPHERDALAR